MLTGILCHGQANRYFSSVLSPKQFDNSIDNGLNSDLFPSVSYYRKKFWDKFSNIICKRRIYEPFVLIKTNVQPNNYFKELSDISLKRVPRDTKQNTSSDDSKFNPSINETLNQTTSTTVASSTNLKTTSNPPLTDTIDYSKITEKLQDDIYKIPSVEPTMNFPTFVINGSNDKTSSITFDIKSKLIFNYFIVFNFQCYYFIFTASDTYKPLTIISVLALIIVTLGKYSF